MAKKPTQLRDLVDSIATTLETQNESLQLMMASRAPNERNFKVALDKFKQTISYYEELANGYIAKHFKPHTPERKTESTAVAQVMLVADTNYGTALDFYTTKWLPQAQDDPGNETPVKRMLALFTERMDKIVTDISAMKTKVAALNADDPVPYALYEYGNNMIADLERELLNEAPPKITCISELHQNTGLEAQIKLDKTKASFREQKGLILATFATSTIGPAPQRQQPVHSTPDNSLNGPDAAQAFSDISQLLQNVTENSQRGGDYGGYKKPGYPRFDGNPLKFAEFYLEWEDVIKPKLADRIFVRMINEHTPADIQLGQCVTADEALMELWKEYSAPQATSSSMLTELLKMDVMPGSNDDTRLVNLYRKVKQIHNDLKILKQEKALESNTLVVEHLMKLIPGNFVHRFSDRKQPLDLAAKANLTGVQALYAQADTKDVFNCLYGWLKDEYDLVYTTRHYNIDRPKKGKDSKSGGGAVGGKPSVQSSATTVEEEPSRDSQPPDPGKSGSKDSKGLYKEDPLRSKQLKMGSCKFKNKGKECGYYHTWKGQRGMQPSDKLADCKLFRELDLEDRVKYLISANFCLKCTSTRHQTKDCTMKNWKCPVKVNDQPCGKSHHRLLHGSTNQTLVQLNATQVCSSKADSPSILRHMVQENVHGKAETTIFMDDGSTASMILHKLAKLLKLKGKEVNEVIEVTNQAPRPWKTMLYTLPWRLSTGEVKYLQLLGCDKITTNVPSGDISAAYSLFPQAPAGSLERPTAEVGILIGQDHSSLLPTGGSGEDCVGDLRLMRTVFGSGYVLSGHHPSITTTPVCFAEQSNSMRTAHYHSRLPTLSLNCTVRMAPLTEAPIPDLPTVVSNSLTSMDFMAAEAVGLQVTPKCNMCLNCPECTIQDSTRTVKEQIELNMLKDSVTHNTKDKCIDVKFPIVGDPKLYKNNYKQAVAIQESNWRRLKKKGGLDPYNEQFNDFKRRGVIKKTTMEAVEAHAAKGKVVNFITHHAVANSHSKSTPLRIVTNSAVKNSWSGPTINELYAKGPNALNSLFDVLIQFRLHLECAVYDLSKAYHKLRTGEDEFFQRLLVWRESEDAPWEIYGYCCIGFGDKPAAVCLELACNIAADLGLNDDELVSLMLRVCRYVDDVLSGGSKEDIDRMVGDITINPDGSLSYSGTISKILARIGFSAKMIVRSGETNQAVLDKVGHTLGLNWQPTMDTIQYDLILNMGKREGAAKLSPDLTKEDIPSLLQMMFTKRKSLQLSSQLFDPLGMICAYTIRIKIALKKVTMLKLEWDDVLPEELLEYWRLLAVELVEAEPIVFPRCVRKGIAGSYFELLGFWDGAQDAFACCIYLRWWDEETQTWHVALLCAKARVTPTGLTIPRSELSGLIILIRLLNKVIKAMLMINLRPARVTCLGDSTCTIAAADINAGALHTFFSNRIVEVISTMTEWGEEATISGKEELPKVIPEVTVVDKLHHLPGDLNVADLPTRGHVEATEIGPGSLWQDGPQFLKQDRSEWPITRDFVRKVPDNEMRKKFLQSNGTVLVPEPSLQPLYITNLIKVFDYSRSLLKVRGIFARIIRSWSTKDRSIAKDPLSLKDAISQPLTAQDYANADKFMLALAMMDTYKLVKSGKAVSLLPFQGDSGVHRLVWMTQGRLTKGALTKTTGHQALIVLSHRSPLAKLIMIQCHDQDHRFTAADALSRTRTKGYWIFKGMKLAEEVAKECNWCRVLRAKTEKTMQRMGCLPDYKFDVPIRPFSTICVDFLAPVYIRDTVRTKKSTRSTVKAKVFPVIVVCMHTEAVHTLLSTSYNVDDLLCQLETLFAIRGTPERIITDLGSQLTKAAKLTGEQEGTQDYDHTQEVPLKELEARTAHLNIIWIQALSQTPWRNGKAEAGIKSLKRTLKHLYKGGLMTYAELQCLLLRAASIMNDRPLGARHTGKAEPDLQVLTPNVLLTGSRTATVVQDLERFNDDSMYTKRMRFMDQCMADWWEHWKEVVFPTLLPVTKWREVTENLAVGDIVIVKTAKGQFRLEFQYAEVVTVKPDSNNIVRTVTVALRPKDKRDLGMLYKVKDPRYLELPVQRVARLFSKDEIK